MLEAPQIEGEQARLAALRAVELLDTAPESSFDDLAQLAANICGTPMALVTLVDEGRQWAKAQVGIDLAELPRGLSFCGHTIAQGGVFEVPDTLEDERFRDNPLVTGEPHVRFYAGHPLVTKEGYALGALCVLDRAPHLLTAVQCEALAAVARLVMRQIERRLANRRAGAPTTSRNGEADAEEPFRATFDHAAIGIAHFGPDGRFVRVNEHLCELLGYPREELQRLSFAEITHPGDVDVSLMPAMRLMTGEIPSFSVEKRYLRKDGSAVWTSITTSAVRSVEGELRYFISFVEDITARRQMEQALRGLTIGLADSEPGELLDRMMALLAETVGVECAFIGQLVADEPQHVRLRVLCLDGKKADSFEYALEGTACAAVMNGEPVLFESDLQRRFPADAMLAEMGIEGYAAVPLIGPSRRPIGHLGVMSRPPLRGGTQLLAILNLFAVRAASELERQRSERRFLDVIEFAPDALILADDAGTVTLVNHQSEALFGYPRSELLGRPIETLIPSEQRHGHATVRSQFHKGSRPRAMGEGRADLRGLRKDGSSFPAEISLSPMESPEGQLVLAAIRDVTSRRKMEDELRSLNASLERQVERRTAELSAAKDAAEHANSAKSTFLATVSHEIRTPMNAIFGMIELLGLTRMDSEQARMVEVVGNSSRLLLQVINDILDFAKIEEGKLDILREPTSLTDLVDQVRQLYSDGASRKGVDLRVESDDALPAAVLCDPLRVKQILFNLTSNAIKFTAQGTVTVRTRLLAIHGLEVVLVIEVEDTGIGIGAEAMESLFKPFVQAETNTTRRFGGTGLGLSISRRLAQLMGGGLTLESHLGTGTTARLTLPLTVADPASLPVRHPLAGPDLLPRGPSALTQGLRLLIADDNDINREVLTRQLRLLGYAVDSASDGAEVIRKWRVGTYGGALIDCHMPDMDGYTVTRHIREIEAAEPCRGRMPIIAYTADAIREHAARCIAVGMDDVVGKPANLETLRSRLSALLAPSQGPAGAGRAQPPVEAAADAAPRPTINWKRLRDFTGGDEDFAHEILRDFLAGKTVEATGLTALLPDGNFAEITRLSHRMRGAAGIAAAEDLMAVCGLLEEAAKRGDRGLLQQLRGEFLAEFLRVKAAIKTACAGNGGG